MRQGGNVKGTELLRFLRQCSGQGTSVTMSVEEEQTNEVMVQVDRSVHCNRYEHNSIWTIDVQSLVVLYFRPDRIL